MSFSRETVRDALAALLTTALVGSGKPCVALYGYPTLDFQGQMPVVTIASMGTERDQETMATRRKSVFLLDVYAFVLQSDSGSSWTEANAEDALDTIEKLVDETVAANMVTVNWRDIGYAGPTTTDVIAIGGEPYRYERIPLRIEVSHD